METYQIQTAIKKPPDLLEIAAFGYFFCGTFTGPLFSLSRFRSFVAGEYLDNKKEVRVSGLVVYLIFKHDQQTIFLIVMDSCFETTPFNFRFMPSLGRFVAACFYMIIHQWGVLWIPNEYFNSPQFFVSVSINSLFILP